MIIGSHKPHIQAFHVCPIKFTLTMLKRQIDPKFEARKASCANKNYTYAEFGQKNKAPPVEMGLKIYGLISFPVLRNANILMF